MAVTQERLPLEGAYKARFSNFVGGPNRGVVSALRDWLEAPDSDLCLLEGPPGSGKTHLLQAAAAWWSGTGQAWRMVPLAAGLDLPQPEQLSGGLCLLDDLHIMHADQALGLMRAIDAAREGHWRLLVSSQQPLETVALPFEDLRSRLQWGTRLVLRELDDDGVLRLLELRAEELGVSWPRRNTAYLLRRLPRQASTMLAVLDTAYRQAVSAGRQISVPLLTQVLQSPQFAAAIQQAAGEPETGRQQ